VRHFGPNLLFLDTITDKLKTRLFYCSKKNNLCITRPFNFILCNELLKYLYVYINKYAIMYIENIT
jgi:hypothetical protein